MVRNAGMILKISLLLFALCVLSVLNGCGKKTAKTRDAVADEVTGYRPIKQGDRLKDQLRKVDKDIDERRKEEGVGD